MKGHTDAVQDIAFDHTGKLLGLSPRGHVHGSIADVMLVP